MDSDARGEEGGSGNGVAVGLAEAASRAAFDGSGISPAAISVLFSAANSVVLNAVHRAMTRVRYSAQYVADRPPRRSVPFVLFLA